MMDWQREFSGGLCAEFAVALHQAFGWPMLAFVEQESDADGWYDVGYAHVVAVPRDGLAADAIGVRRISEVDVAARPGNRIALREVTLEELDEMGMEGLYEEAIDEAAAIVEEHEELWR